MRALRLSSSIAVLVSLSACDTPPAPLDSGGADAGTVIDTGGTPSDASPGTDAPRADAGPAADFMTPADTWTYVPIPGGACGNGSAYGVAVNRSTTSSRVLVYFQGGGACWDNLTCNIVPLASHINDTLSGADVIGEAVDLEDYHFSREASVSPFADATFIYLPYCTGDVHSGDRINEYDRATIHHVGYRNVSGVIGGLVSAFADAERLWVVGSSAGGYGTLVNWYRFREAFPAVRVDALDDSGPPVDIDSSRWTAMIASWEVPAPTGCPECLEALSNVTAYYQRTVTDGDRFALLQYTQDDTIRNYTALSATALSTAVNALSTPFAATTSHRVFILNGASHVVLTNPSRTSGGVVASDWVRAFATDGAGWDNVAP
jgi:hypothetical protein